LEYSRVKESPNKDSKLRLCIEFRGFEDPTAVLHDLGLLVSQGVFGWHGALRRRYQGRAYVLSDKPEDFEKAREELRRRGWTEMPDSEEA
jgi:hypothetical protein